MLRRSLSPETLKLLPEVVFQGSARPSESCSGDRGCCGGVHLGAVQGGALALALAQPMRAPCW